MTVVKNVREVTLFGYADLAFWRDQLAGQRLTPFDDGGRAQVQVSASDLRWMGIRFRELTISVAVSQSDKKADAAYLACAFNSSPLLALAERSLFHTPYYPAQISLEDRAPVTFRLSDGQVTVFEARMARMGTGTITLESAWQGPIFLPESAGQFFYARLEGMTEKYPFTDEDLLMMRPWQAHPALAALIASEFAPLEWRVRPKATHSKSKTYRRT